MKSLSTCAAVVALLLLGPVALAEEPATAAKAAAVLDLAEFPVPEGVERKNPGRLASLSYDAKQSVPDAFAFVKKTLEQAGWAELPGAYSSDQSASATFAKDGFKVSVAAYTGSKPGEASVSIVNNGDVDVKSMPVPADAKPLYATPVSVAYLAPGTVDATAGEVRKALVAQGWEPYGEAGDARFYRRNAVRLTSRVMAAPAQAGKTLVDYSFELMSVELPALEDLVRVQYADTTKELSFDAEGGPQPVFDRYTKLLTDRGWKPLTKQPTDEELGRSLFYKNDRGDLLTLNLHEVDGLSRGRLRHRTAAEVEEMLEASRKHAEKKKAKPAMKPEITLALPTTAKNVKAEAGRIEFKLAAGSGKSAVEALVADLKKDGWEVQADAFEGPAGAASLAKDKLSVSIHYTDVGFGDAEVTIDAIGATLKRKP